MIVVTVAIVTLLVVAILLYGFLLLLARKVAYPRRKKLIGYELVSSDSIAVERTLTTELPGDYGLWVAGGHILVGGILDDSATDRITRRVIAISGAVDSNGSGRWSGHTYPGPQTLDSAYEEISLKGPRGARAAWLFPGDLDSWAIHVHGIHTTRASVLRTVPAFNELGATSLVPSYYADTDNQTPEHPKPTTFGVWESDDVDTAIAYAVDHGAERIVLVGWSMGATIALRLAERSTHADRIVGLVLVSPATNWRALIIAGVRGAGLPRWIAQLVPHVLATRIGARLAGVPIAIPFKDLDWTSPGRPIGRPTLVIHSPGDGDVPFELTEALRDSNGPELTLEEFDAVPHQLEYNADPVRFRNVITQWSSVTK
jgi:pimeloyl-ACP methyl ester carboxylesterase